MRALVAYVRQELSAPAIAIMGYAEMLMDDAVQADREQLTDDLKRITVAKSAGVIGRSEFWTSHSYKAHTRGQTSHPSGLTAFTQY